MPSPIFLYEMIINQVKLICHQRPILFPPRQDCCRVKINNSEPPSRVTTPVTRVRVSMENPGFVYFSIMRYYFLSIQYLSEVWEAKDERSLFIPRQSRNVYFFANILQNHYPHFTACFLVFLFIVVIAQHKPPSPKSIRSRNHLSL